jgi:hypothetical protein
VKELQHGFVATEWVAALALLLLPVVVLVATLPTWAERRNAATIAAREAARTIENEWPRPAGSDATRVAREVAADFGIGPDDITVVTPSAAIPRGGAARVEVWVTMPAISVAGMHAGSWRYRAVGVRRIDDYRSA